MKKIWILMLMLGALMSAQADYRNLDLTMGENGVAITPIVAAESDIYIVNMEATTPDAPYDKIVTMEIFSTLNGGTSNVMITRLDNNGSADTTFGDANGSVIQTNETDYLVHGDMVIQSNEQIVVSTLGYVEASNIIRTMFHRYNTDGSLDTSFGNDGMTSTDINASYGQIHLALQLDTKILAAEVFYNDQTGNFLNIVRYDSNGSIDTTFGTDGVFQILDPTIDNLYGMLIQPDGSSLTMIDHYTVIDENTSVFETRLIKVTSTGELDTSFGDGNGTVSSNGENIIGFTTDASGKITVLSSFWDGGSGPNVYMLTRLDSNGSIDTAYGDNGTVACDYIENAWFDGMRSMHVQDDGKIVLNAMPYSEASTAVESSGSTTNIYRINTDGTLDTSFGLGDGVGGVIRIADNILPLNLLHLAIQYDGKILLGGSSYNELMFNDSIGLMRFNPETLNDLTSSPWTAKKAISPSIIIYLLD